MDRAILLQGLPFVLLSRNWKCLLRAKAQAIKLAALRADLLRYFAKASCKSSSNKPKTIVRKFRFLAAEAKLAHERWLEESILPKPLSLVQFDDLETAEHTKCKPLSVALAVDPGARKILQFQVSQMPPKGLLAKVARKKYGPRKDHRPIGWNKFMESMKPLVTPQAEWVSDENPHYPRPLFSHHPDATHTTHKGRRGCVAGQGELKKIGFDPLFSLNHTCAMLRANLNRLFRRTWCLTKKREGLVDHLWIYVRYHNEQLT